MKRIPLKTIFIFLSLLSCINLNASKVAYFPMEIINGQVYETISNNRFNIESANAPEKALGASGYGVRFDGYSTSINARLNNIIPSTVNTMTVSLWCAVETYPMMKIDVATGEKACIAGNIDNVNKTGFAFHLGSTGNYSFECYTGGWKVTCEAPDKFPCYTWNNLVAVVDAANRKVILYNNGKEVASVRCMDTINMAAGTFMIGRSKDAVYAGPFQINTFNGIIDEICIYDEALSSNEISSWKAENPADLRVPASRFEGSILRPAFHGMPSACWTNEPHGLVKYNGKYHIFFQKNANGPYLSRIHWGHLSSTNLYKWEEENIALVPGDNYDIKGCWSGCVFVDDILTNGKPHIYYTGVDYIKAMMCEAIPQDDNLISWKKNENNPIIPHRPEGLTSDFRDPYMFTFNGKYYMIVGTSKDNLGATTLHKYDLDTKTWSNDGSIFFKGASQSIVGSFWEMPNITKIGEKWLFTATPLGMANGVETIYWVGDINEDGTFRPLQSYGNTPQKIELEGFSRDGYGLLSPSVTTVDGKTIAVGIVPDKLPSEENYKMGWAHNYSLPREWSLDAENKLVQKPYDGLKEMRTNQSYSNMSFPLNGNINLSPVKGSKVEVIGLFKVGNSARFGFRFFKSGGQSVNLYYTPANNVLSLDMRSISRLVNDGGVYNGLYESSLPRTFKTGEILKIQAFIDHSIIDVFINDTWAFSTRVFPTDASAEDVEIFSDGTTEVVGANAWILDEKLSSVSLPNTSKDKNYSIYGSDGMLVYSNIPEGSIITIFDITGGKLAECRVNNDSVNNMKLDYKGIVIAKIDYSGTSKVIKCII